MKVIDGYAIFPIKTAWFELPSADSADGIEAILESAQPPDDESTGRLRAAIEGVQQVAAGLAPGNRANYGLILWPETGRVEALLSIRVVRTVPEGYDNYLRTARGFHGNDRLDLVNRTVDEVMLPFGRAVLSHDFSLPREREGVPGQAMERVFVAAFPEEGRNAIEFTLLTHNLSLFDDAGGYLMALASGEDPPIPGTE